MVNKFSLTAFFFLCLLVFSRQVHAQWETNFLLGVSGSLNERLGNEDITLLYTNPVAIHAGFPSSFIIEGYTDRGWMLGAFGGFQARCWQWLFGGEVNVDWDDIDSAHPFAFDDAFGQAGVARGLGWNATTRYKRKVTIGLTGRIGYAVTRCFMPYLRLGAETSIDQLITTYSGNSNVYPLSLRTFGSVRQYRFLGGVGVEIPVPKISPLSFRIEYDFHSKGKAVQSIGLIEDTLGYSPEFFTTMKPRMHSGKVSLVWNF